MTRVIRANEDRTLFCICEVFSKESLSSPVPDMETRARHGENMEDVPYPFKADGIDKILPSVRKPRPRPRE